MVGPYADSMVAEQRAEQAALVALLRERPRGMSWAEITGEVVESGSARAVRQRLARGETGGLFGDDALAAATDDVDAWTSEGLTFLTILDEDYPARLREVHQAPPVLFARGALLPGERAVSVVGSRSASPRGLDIAKDIAVALVDRGITVAGGLALGIDSAAHRTALDAGGRTVAVIGTGIRRVYPAANRGLHEEIVSRGLLLSQFWPDAPPQKHTFLMRNATMSGYGMATVVVEAGETSGARAQARMAVEHGRPVILTDFVVERNDWARELQHRPGVHVAKSTTDVMDVLRDIIHEEESLRRELAALVGA